MKEQRNADWCNYVTYNQVSEADAHFGEASAGVKCYRELELDDINSYLENLYVFNQAWDDMFSWDLGASNCLLTTDMEQAIMYT